MIPNLTAPPRQQLPLAARYGASLALIAVAALATTQTPKLLEPMRFLYFWGAVLLATLIGGTGAGLTAVAASVLVSIFLGIPGAHGVENREDLLRLAVYALLAAAISVAVGLRNAADRRADMLREWLATTLQSIGDGVIVTDAEQNVVFLNPVAASLTGWQQESAAGRPIGEIFVVRHEETLEPIENPVWRVLHTSQTAGFENHTILLTRDGKTIPIDDSAAPIRNSVGAIRGVVLVFRDVTRKRLAEKALIQADNAKDQFLATLSHDLRTPLTAILGWTRLLQIGGLDEKRESEALETIEQNAKVQAALVEDILDVTRIASGKIALERSDIDFTEIVKEAALSLQPSISAKRMSLDLRLTARQPMVSGDPKRVRQIVWNLLSNAIKFSQESGSIEVHLQNADSFVELEVIDHGIGIGSDVLPQVFDRFGQGHGEHSRKLGGLGLGLSIASDLAKLHGGSVTARSDGHGQGSTFTVRLPVIARLPSPP